VPQKTRYPKARQAKRALVLFPLINIMKSGKHTFNTVVQL